MNSPTLYPDISEILRRKAEGRRALAKLSFGEKITRMEALRARLAPFKAAREAMRRPSLNCAGSRGFSVDRSADGTE